MQVGLIGLGLMGSAVAARLLGAGHRVIGFDIDEARRGEHLERGGELAASSSAAAEVCGVTILSLPDSDVVRAVCLGPEGIAQRGRPDGLIVDATTGRPTDTMEVAATLAERGLRFVDATVSGNSRVVLAGQAVVMVGGDAFDVAEVRPLLLTFARSVHHVGGVGAGIRTKLIVNMVLGINRLALAEGLVVGEKAGIDLDTLLTVLRDASSYSRAMDIHGESMLAGQHFPPAARIRQTHKDFKLILEWCRSLGAPALLSSIVQQVLQQGEMTGLADADNSAVLETLRRQAGIGRVRG